MLTQSQCATLRALLPEDQQLLHTGPDFDEDTQNEVLVEQNLQDWVHQISGSLGDGAAIETAVNITSRVEVSKHPFRKNNESRCPVKHNNIPQEAHQLEQDFTPPSVNAPRKQLCESCEPYGFCPFATSVDQEKSGSSNGKSRQAACPVNQSQPNAVRATSVAGSIPAACPIRFLKQHSPEEVAAYFEEHKHELPRSHEICVKRFGTDEESIRTLDAKYGSLVNMIQGLGKKHEPMLPQEPYPEAMAETEQDQVSKTKIRNWAASVDDSDDAAIVQAPAVEVEDGEEDSRESRFDRPLRDVRLGESPSRPWGVHVPPHMLDRHPSTASSLPAAYPDTTETAESRPPAEVHPPLAPDDKLVAKLKVRRGHGEAVAPVAVADMQAEAADPKGKCPFDYKAMTWQSPVISKPAPTQAVVQDVNLDTDVKADSSAGNAGFHTPTATLTPAGIASANHAEVSHLPSSRPPSVLTNRGVIVASNAQSLDWFSAVENLGTILLGYSAQSAVEYVNGLNARQ